MAQLAIDKGFLDDYSRLEKPVQAAVKAAMDKFAEPTHAGLHLEKINKAKDDRLRTIRIDQFWRGVLMAPDSGDTYYLLKVMPHDKALQYAASHRLSVNRALGVVEVRDQDALDEITNTLEQAAQAAGATLLDHVSDADLTRLGVDGNTRTIARLLTTVAHLEAMQSMIPEAQYNALYGLAAGQAPKKSGPRSPSTRPRAPAPSTPPTSSRRWSAPRTRWSSSTAATSSTASCSTRSRGGGPQLGEVSLAAAGWPGRRARS